MKSLITEIGVLLLLVSACQSPEQPAQQRGNPLQGTWKLIEVSNADTTIDVTEAPVTPRMVVSPTHYAIGWQTDEGIYGSGGRYEYDGDTLTEMPQYHSTEEYVGDTYTYDVRLEGDSIWHKTGTNVVAATGDTNTVDEIWRRIE